MASAEGQRPSRIAGQVGCAIGTVHNTLHAFEEEGTLSEGEGTRPQGRPAGTR
ncbi:helix-turn-helix domain-containing protein [Gemmata massiliana]|uniref:helix-turn-helix domain-containing protein n=1 Tax=Gemmata massiliana TaxID=1210884 RepID=UPI0018D96168